MTTKQLIGIIIVALTTLGAIAMITNKPDVNEVTTENVPTQQIHGTNGKALEYDAFRGEFMKGCMTEATFVQCDCLYVEIEGRLGRDTLATESLMFYQTDVMTPKLEQAMVQSVLACIHLY